MTVLEMQSQPRTPSRPVVRWTEVCTAEHVGAAERSLALRSPEPPVRTAAPGPRARVRPAVSVGAGVRACHAESASGPTVVDDVPTWVLLACGLVFGLVLLLLVALVGGPAYA